VRLQFLQQILWARTTLNINVRKPKKCDLEHVRESSNTKIWYYKSYKLLGIRVTESLKWDVHVTAMLSKASKRIHFLKHLGHVGVSAANLVTYYNCVIWSVLEYTCPVWHSQEIERLQKRAFQCIFGDVSYVQACSSLGLSTLADHREQLTRHFLNSWNDLTAVSRIWCHWNVINLSLVTCEMLACTNRLKLELFVLPNRFYRIV